MGDLEPERNGLRARVAELEKEVSVGDQIIENRNRVLDAVPCPAHGQCVPYAEERLKAMHGLALQLGRLQEAVKAALKPEAKKDRGKIYARLQDELDKPLPAACREVDILRDLEKTAREGFEYHETRRVLGELDRLRKEIHHG